MSEIEEIVSEREPISEANSRRRAEFIRRSNAMKKVANDPAVQEKRRATFAITKFWKERTPAKDDPR